MKALAASLKRKDIEISAKRYGTDALVAMAQRLFCSLLIGTIINTIGAQLHLAFLASSVAMIAGTEYTAGGLASAMSGPAMATVTGWALRCSPPVPFLPITIGPASNALGGAGGPLAVLFVAILAAKAGKAVSKETRVDILVISFVTIAAGLLFSVLLAPTLSKAAMKVDDLVIWAMEFQSFLTGILVSFVVGTVLTLPISSATIRAAFGLTGLAGGAASVSCCAQMVGFAVTSYPENGFGGLVSQGISTSMLQIGNIVRNLKVWIAPCVTSMITGPIATCVFHPQQNGAVVISGMGTRGLVGPLGVYTGWAKDVAAGQKVAITGTDWLGMLLAAVILPAVLCPLTHAPVRRMGLVRDGGLKLA